MTQRARNLQEETTKEISLQEEITRNNCSAALKLICEKSGMSFTKFAETLGVNQTSLSHIKKEARKPSKDLMNKLQAVALIKSSEDASSGESDTQPTVESVVAGLAAIARTTFLAGPA